MSQSSGILCCWPGLHSLWRDGRPAGMATALVSAILLNGTIIATFVAPELVPDKVRYALWGVLVVGWWWATRCSRRRLLATGGRVVNEVNEGLFLRAQAEYLKGHWFEAETPLREILKTDPDDIDARLLLAGLLRRSARYEEAQQQLGRLEKLPRSHKWEAEIRRELALLPNRAPDGIPRIAMGSLSPVSAAADRPRSDSPDEGGSGDTPDCHGWGSEGFKSETAPDRMRRAA
jgi:hypothetical protein